MMSSEPKRSTLRDYLTVLRRRALLLIGIVLIGVAAAVGLTVTQDETYAGESSIRFRDLNESYAKVGLLPPQGELPAQISAQGAEAVTDPAVFRSVISNLGLEGTTVDDLEGQISADQEPQSNLVEIVAESESAEGAAALANQVATTAVRLTNRDVRKDFKSQATDLEAQADQIDVPRGSAIDLNNEERAQFTESSSQRQELLDLVVQYQALGTVAVVAEVATTANLPTSPSTTPALFAGLVGALLGLILALVVIAIVESLDRRLHTTDDAQELLDMPIIGVVLEDGMGELPVSESPGEQEVSAMNSFRILRTNLNFIEPDRPPKSVLVTSALAEEGKTTVAIGMALAASALGRVLLVEADLHRPVHAGRLGLKEKPGLVDYLAGDASPQEILQVYEFDDPGHALLHNGGEPERSGLVCISAGSRTPWATELLSSQRFKSFLEEVRDAYDLVVIDSAPLLGVAETSRLVALVDSVAFCVRIGRTTGEQARSGQAALQRLPERPTGLVVTGLSTGDRGYYSYAYSYGAERHGATV